MYKKKMKNKIVVIVVLAMLLQIVGPLAAIVYGDESENFKIVDERIEDGTAYIDWEFDLDMDNPIDGFSHILNFTIDEALEDYELIAEDETVIGKYSISEDGELTVVIDEELYMEAGGEGDGGTSGENEGYGEEEPGYDEENDAADIDSDEEEDDEESSDENNGGNGGINDEIAKLKAKVIATVAYAGEELGDVIVFNETKTYSGTIVVEDVIADEEGTEADKDEEGAEADVDGDADEDMDGEEAEAGMMGLFGGMGLSGEGSRDLLGSETEGFLAEDGSIEIGFYSAIDDKNPGNNQAITEEPIILEELLDSEGKGSIYFGIEVNGISDDFEFKDGDYLEIDISPLIGLAGFVGEDLEEKVTIYAPVGDEVEVGEYGVIGEKLRVEITEGSAYNTYNGQSIENRFISAFIGFDIEGAINKGSLIEEIVFESPVEKTFTIRRLKVSTEITNGKFGIYNESNDTITWIIDINTELAAINKEVTFTDEIPVGLAVTEVAVYDLEIKLNGAHIELSGIEQNLKEVIENDVLKVSWDNLNQKAKRVVITTKIKEGADLSIYLESGGKYKIENTANLHVGEGEPEDIKGDTGLFERKGSITKSARVSGNIITWKVDYRGTGMGTYSITDTLTLPKEDEKNLLGLLLIRDSITVKEGTDDLNYDKSKVSIKDKVITFTELPNENTNLKTLIYKTEVVYNTKVVYDEKNKDNTTYIIENEVNDGKGNTDSEKVTIKRDSLFEKKYSKRYGENGDTYVDWEIVINKNNEKWQDVEIWEYVPDGFVLDTARESTNVYSVEVVKEGDVVSKFKDDEGKYYNKLLITQNSDPGSVLDEKITIIVTTKLIKPKNLIEGAKNKAKIRWKPHYKEREGYIGIGTGGWDYLGDKYLEDEVEGYITLDELELKYSASKTEPALSLPYDGDGNTDRLSKASWEIKYETFNSSMAGHYIVDGLTDVYTAVYKGSHEYVKDSFKVKFDGKRYDLSVTDAVYGKIGDPGSELLQYKLEFGAVDPDKPNFKFTIVDGSKVTSPNYNKIILQYDTQFVLSEMKEPSNNGQIQLNNNVVIKDGSNKDTASSSSNVNINETVSQNGRKIVKEQYETGTRVFSWRAELNHKGKTITANSVIKDVLSGGPQKYDIESIKIYKARLKDNSNLEIVEEAGRKVVLKKGEDYSLVDHGGNEEVGPIDYTDGNGDTYHKGLSFKFLKEINTPLIIEYQTEAVGMSAETYGNTITLLGKKCPSSITYKEYDKFIDKEALIDLGGKIYKGDILDWQIVVNKSLSKIYNFELTDEMGDGLLFIKGTLEVKKNDNIGAKDEFDITYKDADGFDEGNDYGGFTISKKNKSETFIEDQYTIKYSTLVNMDKGVEIILNEAKISGTKISDSEISKPTYTISSRRSAFAGGTLVGNNYGLKIIKVDEGGNTITDGEATFELITYIDLILGGFEFKEEIVEKIETENGEIEYLLEKKNGYSYKIIEVEAPTGYVKSADEYKVNFDDANEEKTIEIKVDNEKINGAIKITKEDNEDVVVKGAKFGLFQAGSDAPIEEFVRETNKNGELVFNNVPYGTYVIKEIEAPEGYIKSDEGKTVIINAENHKKNKLLNLSTQEFVEI